ncbi:BURP domain protein RD22-like [Populus alba]|uniref:BURP domain protein RD22-like n=1 Tax=Populus alba TaxID=43335 RepID=UPI003CC762CE
MSLANSCALLLLFFLTLSLFITSSTAANTIGVTRTTVAVAADNVPLPKKVATFLPSDISPPTEKYWCSRLPNTPLPKALRYLLQPGHYPSINREFANENVSAAVILRTYRIRYRISYKRDDKKSLNAALPDSTIFYQYDDLHPGKKMKVLFTESGTKVSFLPRQVAESIPFSSDKLPEILKYFKLEVNSKEAQVIREEIGGCEEPNMEGEEKYCATSLESLIDFSFERLGQNVRVLSTEAGKKQEYTVSAAVRMIGDHKAAVCHKMRYPYAVHYCHVIADTEVDEVALVGADGTKVKAVTVCHLNTSAWSPDHMAFQVLKIKPGPAVCHFLDSDTLVWVPKKDKKMTP